MGRKDAVTKRFCSDRVRFADLVNGVYFDGRKVIHSEDLTMSSESYTQPIDYTGQEEKRQYQERVRDIKMLHKYGSTIRILAIEHQSYIDYGMPVRCMEQDFTMFHTSLRSVFELLLLRKDKKRLLEKLTGDEAYSHMDEDSLEFLSVVMDNPAIWKNRHKFKKSVNKTEDIDKDEQEEYDMCQAIKELIEDGKQEGIMVGRSEGRIDALRHCVENLMKSLSISLEKACELLGSSQEDYEELRQTVNTH